MIHKPPAALQQADASARTLERLRSGANLTVHAARTGRLYVRALICWGFALIWGVAALGAGLSLAGLPTFLGVGTMAAAAAWMGTRLLAKARASH